MVGLNKIMIIGNVGTDPEMRYTPNGNAVTSFRMASTRSYTAADGERKQDTEWFTVVAWNQLAEHVNQYLSKGRRAYVEGRLHSNSWSGQDGQTRFSNEIIANTVLFLDRAADSPVSQDSSMSQDSPEQASESHGNDGQIDANDLPF